VVTSTPCIVVAGTNSGVGKTTVVSGLCGAFRSLGLKVSVFKCGPDYLDPTYHFRASGVRSQTLDGWMMGREGVLSTFQSASSGSDIAVIEGVMGLFDGVVSTSDAGSTAEIAKWLGAPVVLVIDASGMSRSVAAMAGGFASFDPELRVAGVICNRVGSKRHLEMLEAASTAVPVLGGLPKDPKNSFPERHLGLRTADEATLSGALFEAWAGHVREWCNVEAVLNIARTASAPAPAPPPVRAAKPCSCRIGIAMDEAFHFYYDENLRLLKETGAEMIEFSPIHAAHLPDVDGLYLGGGYPEVHAEALAANTAMRAEILAFCRSGKPVYAECGGLMYLCEGLRQLDGSRSPMVGWFHADAVMSDRLQALGYVEVSTRRDTILGPSGRTFRGHQFRYSTLEWTDGAESAYDLERRRDGQLFDEGYWKSRVLGSYVHAHWASNPSVAYSFVDACNESGINAFASAC
jgi:cobyrinic acid a,c-diamide synthase